MNSATLAHDHPLEGHAPASPATSQFGMIVFLISEAMLFAGLLSGYFVLRWAENGFPWQPDGQWPPEGVHVKLPILQTAIATVFLLSSSVTYHLAEVALGKGRSGLRWLLATLLLGSIFIGFQIFEWLHLHHEGLWFHSCGIFGSSFFVITGFHGMHVLVGLLLIFWVMGRQALTRCYTPARHVSLNNVGLYWHFVDVVWIFVFTLLYLV